MNTLLIEVIVLITIGWATTVYWLTRKWLRQKVAWQWWHEQQALQLHHQAESIRDGLLQQTFAFRRYLENSPESYLENSSKSVSENTENTDRHLASHQPAATPTTHWLEQFQTFYQSLESLSNDLSPPFVADSLPLALQFVLKDWARCQGFSLGSEQAQRTLQLDLPADWPLGSPAKNKIILSIVTRLLSLLTSPDTRSQQLQLTLSHELDLRTLSFTLDGNKPQSIEAISRSPEIQHLKEIFHSLAAGRLEISHEGELVTGQLCWRDESLALDS
ncbi:MAG: hypothetical protein WBD47_19090 [Phormidesmis sp.]